MNSLRRLFVASGMGLTSIAAVLAGPAVSLNGCARSESAETSPVLTPEPAETVSAAPSSDDASGNDTKPLTNPTEDAAIPTAPSEPPQDAQGAPSRAEHPEAPASSASSKPATKPKKPPDKPTQFGDRWGEGTIPPGEEFPVRK